MRTHLRNQARPGPAGHVAVAGIGRAPPARFGALAGALVTLAGLAALPARAEEATEPPGRAESPMNTTPGIAPLSAAQAMKTRPPPRRSRTGDPMAAVPGLPPGESQASLPRGRYEPAPVPNRSLEAPRPAGEAARQDQPSLSPSILYKHLPTPNRAAEGAPSQTETHLFTPGPGATLKVPFSY